MSLDDNNVDGMGEGNKDQKRRSEESVGGDQLVNWLQLTSDLILLLQSF